MTVCDAPRPPAPVSGATRLALVMAANVLIPILFPLSDDLDYPNGEYTDVGSLVGL